MLLGNLRELSRAQERTAYEKRKEFEEQLRKALTEELEKKIKENEALVRERGQDEGQSATGTSTGVEACTQTAVDEDCLWNEEATEPVAVTGDAIRKYLDQLEEAKKECPVCSGKVGTTSSKHASAAAAAVAAKAKAEKVAKAKAFSKSSSKKLKRRARKAGKKAAAIKQMQAAKLVWRIPQNVRHFLSNLPKTVEAKNPRDLVWTSREISQIYFDKSVADAYDVADGIPMGNMVSFLIELYLMRHGLRRLAELQMHELVMAVKANWRRNSKIRMFALFTGLVLEEDTLDEDVGSGKMGLDVLIVYLYVRRKLLTPPVHVPPIPTPPLEHQFGAAPHEDSTSRRASILDKSELQRRRRQSIQLLGLTKKTPVEIEVATGKIDNVFAKYERAVKARQDAIRRLQSLSL